MPAKARLPLWVGLSVAALLVLGHAVRYRSLPVVQQPEVVTWCGATWERDAAVEPAPSRLYPVMRQPPLVGTRFSSPHPPEERRRLGRGDMPEACGGQLVARDGERVVSYVAPG